MLIAGSIRTQGAFYPAILKIEMKSGGVVFQSYPKHNQGIITAIEKFNNSFYCGVGFSDDNIDFLRVTPSLDTINSADIGVSYYGPHYPVGFFEKNDSIYSMVKYPYGLIISLIDSSFNVFTKDSISVFIHNVSNYSLNIDNLDSIYYVPFASKDIFVSQIQGKTNPLSTLCFNYKGQLHYQHNFDSTQYYKGIGVIPTPTGPISVGYRYTAQTHPDSVKTKLVLLKLDRNGSLVDLSDGEIEPGNTIEFYPNPANDYISIQGLEGPCEVSVFSIDGKILLTQSIGRGGKAAPKAIDISGLNDGVYVLQVSSGSKFIGRGKFIISR